MDIKKVVEEHEQRQQEAEAKLLGTYRIVSSINQRTAEISWTVQRFKYPDEYAGYPMYRAYWQAVCPSFRTKFEAMMHADKLRAFKQETITYEN